MAEGSNELRDVDLGSAAELVTKTLRVRAMVSPVNVATRRTSVTCTFKSDAPEAQETCGDDDHGDEVVRFTVTRT